jgi:hypothetical protein
MPLSRFSVPILLNSGHAVLGIVVQMFFRSYPEGIPCPFLAVFLLVITTHYGQWLCGKMAIGAGDFLAYNGKSTSYTYYILQTAAGAR